MLKDTISFAISFAFSAALLFAPAGTFVWPQAWVLLALFYGCSVLLGWWLSRIDPALLAERKASPLGANQTLRDRLVMLAIIAGFCVWFVIMGLDRRFGWSPPIPILIEGSGAILILLTFAGWTQVLRFNSFAATTIRLQPERGQTVIDHGPYAVVRHPMYSYVLLMGVGAPLLLGTLWGLAGLALIGPLLATRIAGEEAILRTGLAGYRDYADRVRFRLVPGLW